jgi:hypothetical protein
MARLTRPFAPQAGLGDRLGRGCRGRSNARLDLLTQPMWPITAPLTALTPSTALHET